MQHLLQLVVTLTRTRLALPRGSLESEGTALLVRYLAEVAGVLEIEGLVLALSLLRDHFFRLVRFGLEEEVGVEGLVFGVTGFDGVELVEVDASALVVDVVDELFEVGLLLLFSFLEKIKIHQFVLLYISQHITHPP